MNLLITISIVASVLAGFVLLFILVPYWILHRSQLTRRKKLITRFSLVGVAVPLLFAVLGAVTQREILSFSVWVWPSSLMMMGLDGNARVIDLILGFTMAGLSNVGLYALIGWVVGLLRYPPKSLRIG